MNDLLARFSRLPRAVQVGSLIVLAVVMAAGFVLLRSPKAVAAFVAGLATIGLLLIGYEHLLRRSRARQLAPLEQGIRGNAAAASFPISEPARRARLDDLRRNFESGLEKFRDAGKDLYSLPWYLVVGEPGSGKTEAIRRCNVGFPPGLQDQFQGAGGTLNMNWWFTNQAVLLDTAGRLMFEEVEPGATTEWQEFLRMLRRSRPNCPVNGMLLVIPAESLIRDTADEIEAKAGKIAGQLDQIQRALAVRFPVYVVVTKCDLINGFREFFDDTGNPQLQHQMLGWSNPAPLDAPFDPERVDAHLGVVKSRLLRRRLGLLADPVNTDDPRAGRTEQVDALYEFPEAFTDIGPRLRRYLSMMFVAGEWSARPLFLRGIYFTSSMREGGALDAKLAEALGVPVESLPDGRVWERDRSFFLRDLFMAKVFRERGLVTRAANAGRQRTARRALVYGSAAAGLLVLGSLSVYGHRSMDRTLVGPTAFWSSMAAAASAGSEPADPGTGLEARVLPIIGPASRGSAEFVYRAASDTADPLLDRLPIEGSRKTRARIHQELRERGEERLAIPWVYTPFAAASGGEGDLARAGRLAAARGLYEAGVLRPLLDAARLRLKVQLAESRPWTPASTDALAVLLRACAAAVAGVEAPTPELDPLLRFALGSGSDPPPGVAPADIRELEAIGRSLAGRDRGEDRPPVVPAGAWAAELEAGADAFLRSLDAPAAETGLARVSRLAAALEAFDAAERSLHAIDIGLSPAEWAAEWGRRFGALAEAHARVETAAGVLDGRSLPRAFADELSVYREARGLEVKGLLDALGQSDSGVSTAEGPRDAAALGALLRIRGKLTAGSERLGTSSKAEVDLASSLARLDALHLADPARPSYRVRFAVYGRVTDRFAGSDPAQTAGDPAGVLAAIESDLASDVRIIDEEMRERLGVSREAVEANTLAAAARATARKGAGLGAEARRAAMLGQLGAALPASADAVAAAVAKAAVAGAGGPAVLEPASPMLRFLPSRADPRYDPGAVAAVLGEYAAVRKALRAEPGAAPRSGADRAASEYLGRYLDHWTSGLAGSIQIEAPATYAELREGLARVADAGAILRPLALLYGRAKDALDRITPLIDPADVALRGRLESAQRSVALAGSAVESPEFGQLCAGVLARWKSLPADAEAARRVVTASTGAADSPEPYIIRAAADDFVRHTWQDLTVAWARTLTGVRGPGSSPPAPSPRPPR